MMRRTLRRSCTACAKSKLRCDLQTPKCSRCSSKNLSCSYANQPASSIPINRSASSSASPERTQELSVIHTNPLKNESARHSLTPSRLSPAIDSGSLDPFNSYPQTGLARDSVQLLMRHFLSKIAFQYYPLDLSPKSNPFVVSWWPLALADPALFHVSLQTASLDYELLAQKGFPLSELLMRDSVSLLRMKVQDESLACQDATMDAVVTLAAIEHGKGNHHVSIMHVEALKRIVKIRGGISAVKSTSPLTARMVPWVALLVMGTPQFQTQHDKGPGDGIAPPRQWYLSKVGNTASSHQQAFAGIELDPEVEDVLIHLQNIFQPLQEPDLKGSFTSLQTTDLHDLTCFVLHKLLFPEYPDRSPTPISECFRYGMSIYMFIIHGPTYYSHAFVLRNLVIQLQRHIKLLNSLDHVHETVSIWLLSIGMIASQGTEEQEWFKAGAKHLSVTYNLTTWGEIECRLKNVLWLDTGCGLLFRGVWESIFAARQRLPVEEVTAANTTSDLIP